MATAGHLDPYCPYFAAAMGVVGKRWAGEVLRALIPDPLRFGALASAIPGLTESTLSLRLKELEAAELVGRVVHSERPVRVEYRLTAKGRALGAVLLDLNSWALEWMTPVTAPPAVTATSPVPPT
ncbi:transcriptional regulator, HxlR family [Williamsia deligens]|nr:transcriptional regulator, HxlR family [Williamsia deligens]